MTQQKHLIAFSVELNWIAPQPRTKPVEAPHKNPFFSLSSEQKWKPSPNECPRPPPPPPTPYPMLFRTTRKLLVFTTKVSKTTINRGWGGCVFSLFREDGSTAQKLANRWNCFCINSFAEVNVALFWSSMTELTEWLVKAHQDKIQSGQPMYRFY